MLFQNEIGQDYLLVHYLLFLPLLIGVDLLSFYNIMNLRNYSLKNDPFYCRNINTSKNKNL